MITGRYNYNKKKETVKLSKRKRDFKEFSGFEFSSCKVKRSKKHGYSYFLKCKNINKEEGDINFHSKNFIISTGINKKIGNVKSIAMGFRRAKVGDTVRVRSKPSLKSKTLKFCNATEKNALDAQEKSGDSGKEPEDIYGKKQYCRSSIPEGVKISLIARTEKKQKIKKWNNYWYYIEYLNSEAFYGGGSTYGINSSFKNAWVYGEFVDLE